MSRWHGQTTHWTTLIKFNFNFFHSFICLESSRITSDYVVFFFITFRCRRLCLNFAQNPKRKPNKCAHTKNVIVFFFCLLSLYYFCFGFNVYFSEYTPMFHTLLRRRLFEITDFTQVRAIRDYVRLQTWIKCAYTNTNAPNFTHRTNWILKLHRRCSLLFSFTRENWFRAYVSIVPLNVVYLFCSVSF